MNTLWNYRSPPGHHGEIYTTNMTVFDARPASGWQLRGEFWATSSRRGDRQLADQVIETIRELDLQPLQLERIQKAMLEVVHRASFRGQTVEVASPVHIRIWVAGECRSGRSWGFFLVEKPDSVPQGVPVETNYLLELFLYKEREP